MMTINGYNKNEYMSFCWQSTEQTEKKKLEISNVAQAYRHTFDAKDVLLRAIFIQIYTFKNESKMCHFDFLPLTFSINIG